MSDKKKEHSKIVEFDGQKVVMHRDKKGGIVITPMMQGYDSGVDCPDPLTGDVCPFGYTESCVGGTVWCEPNQS